MTRSLFPVIDKPRDDHHDEQNSRYNRYGQLIRAAQGIVGEEGHDHLSL